MARGGGGGGGAPVRRYFRTTYRAGTAYPLMSCRGPAARRFNFLYRYSLLSRNPAKIIKRALKDVGEFCFGLKYISFPRFEQDSRKVRKSES